MAQAKKELDAAQAAVNNFTYETRKRRERSQAGSHREAGRRLRRWWSSANGIMRTSMAAMAATAIGAEGGKVGPALDRAGFRLNATWVYRWLKNPQAMNAETRMPALGLSDADAKAVTMYLTTLRAAGNPEGSTKSRRRLRPPSRRAELRTEIPRPFR